MKGKEEMQISRKTHNIRAMRADLKQIEAAIRDTKRKYVGISWEIDFMSSRAAMNLHRGDLRFRATALLILIAASRGRVHTASPMYEKAGLWWRNHVQPVLERYAVQEPEQEIAVSYG